MSIAIAGNRALAVGAYWEGSTGAMRTSALTALGFDVQRLDYAPRPPRWMRPMSKVAHKVRLPLDVNAINREILLRVGSYDLLWLDKALVVRRRTLTRVKRSDPRVAIVGHSPDDMVNPRNSSRYFEQHLPLYDLFITTKSYNVPELTALGAPHVVFINKGFDPDIHRPIPPGDAQQAIDVGFIGTYEGARAEDIRRLALAGVHVAVSGNQWDSWMKRRPPNITWTPPVYARDYAARIARTKVNLCFLRKQNRDLQTARSVEIPACGGFMLAERTDEHLALFREGVEAEFFADVEELIDKARYYVAHDEQRERIAAAGRERCLRDDYTYRGQLGRALALASASSGRTSS